MCAKKAKTTKKKIVSAAWKLFYEQGYDNTTVDDIVEESGTSKGSFYHYFEGKDALLSSLSFLFDEKYEELMPSVDPQMHSVDKLLYLNRELFGVIENTVSLELLARLFSSQLITKGERHLLDSSRVYYKILRQIISEGQQRGQIRSDITANEISKLYAVAERGLMYDWCICGGNYSLKNYAASVMPLLLAVGSAFIWDFEVTGNDIVPTESVLQALERCGVRVGTRGVGLDQDELRNRVLPLLPDVVYLAVNVRGCTAHVQVVERVRPPHLYRDSDVQNIVAARDGLITKIEALDGVTCAAVGETVQAGQVLLSGVADSPRGCRYMRATGRIWARTWYEWTVPVPLETVLKDGTEPVKTRTHTALDLGRHRIALPAGDSILQGRENCDKIIRYRGVQLPFGLRLPVTLVTETVAERAVYDGQRPEDEARAEGQKQLEAQLAQTIGDDGRVLKADVSARRQGAYLMVTLRAECEEQIGVDAPLTITSDTGR